MEQIILHIGVTLKQTTRSCGVNDPNRKTFRFDKLEHKKELYVVGIFALKTWGNPPMAPPLF